MKRMTKFIVFGTGAVLLAGSIAACSHHRTPEKRAEWMTEKVSKELKLDDAQQARLKTLSDEMLSVRKQMRQEFGNDRNEVLSLLDQSKLDQAKLLGMVKEHTRTINEQAPKVVAALGDFYDSLSPEQQAEVRKFIQEHREHHHRRWDHD
jgi:Spy/CpxP family protein refolding chaperone